MEILGRLRVSTSDHVGLLNADLLDGYSSEEFVLKAIAGTVVAGVSALSGDLVVSGLTPSIFLQDLSTSTTGTEFLSYRLQAKGNSFSLSALNGTSTGFTSKEKAPLFFEFGSKADGTEAVLYSTGKRVLLAGEAATVTEVDKKANIISPQFSGSPTAPNATKGDETLLIANTAFVTGAIKALRVSPAFSGTPTINSVNIATEAFITNKLANKADLASPVFTGSVKAPATEISGQLTLTGAYKTTLDSVGVNGLVVAISQGSVVSPAVNGISRVYGTAVPALTLRLSTTTTVPATATTPEEVITTRNVGFLFTDEIITTKFAVFEVTPTAPTAKATDNSTSLATTAFITRAVANALTNIKLLGLPTAPTVAISTGNGSVATTEAVKAVTDLKAPLADPVFTGTVTAPATTLSGVLTLTGGRYITDLDSIAKEGLKITTYKVIPTGKEPGVEALRLAPETSEGFLFGEQIVVTSDLTTKADLLNPTFTGVVKAAAVAVSGATDTCWWVQYMYYG